MSATPDAVRAPDDVVDDPDEAEHRHVTPGELGEVAVDADGDGKPTITVPISSTEPHRSGSVMTRDALESMAEQLEAGEVGLWDDHGLSTETGWREYRREDMYGRWVAAEIDEDGVLWATAELMEGDDRTASLLEQLEQDMPVGFSVGYIALNEEMLAVEDGEEGEKVRHILDVDLMETSPVGIPDNRQAVAAASAIATELEQADVALDAGEAMDVVRSSIQEALQNMPSDTETDSTDPEGADAPEANDAGDDTPETRDHSTDEVLDVVDAVLNAARDAIEQELAEGDGEDDDEEEEEDDEDEDDEESNGVDLSIEGADGEDELPEGLAALQERFDALEERNDELEERLEEKEATIERLESESRDSAGRKGMSPAAGDGGSGQDGAGDGAEGASGNDRQRNALEESVLLTEGN